MKSLAISVQDEAGFTKKHAQTAQSFRLIERFESQRIYPSKNYLSCYFQH